MYIKEVEIDNFKSFANKVTIPFLKGFTTISGPNGSGKSNIIDSVLFALGLSTSRTLRAEKISQLISTHTRRNEAIVKVTFAPEGGEEKEFSVARKIKKSSQGYNSIYYLNDKIVTLTDVHTVLEKYNITPNSYNVIMQNDVMSITNCSDVERRKIIDEIAGVADFDRRIEQAQNELGTVEARVQNSLLILTEVETRLEQLKEEREIALKYQKLRDEKTELESKITAVTMLWFTMTICIVFVADSLWLRCMLGVILAGVTWHLLSFRTMAKDENLHIVKVNTPCLIEQAAIVNGTSTDDIISRIAAGSEYYILRNAVMPVGTMSVKLCRDGIMHLEHMNLISTVHRDSYERQAFMFLEYRCKYMGFHTIHLTVSKNDIQTAASLRDKGFSIIADATENDTYTMLNTFDTRHRRIA